MGPRLRRYSSRLKPSTSLPRRFTVVFWNVILILRVITDCFFLEIKMENRYG